MYFVVSYCNGPPNNVLFFINIIIFKTEFYFIKQTSLAIVVIKTAGRTFAIEISAWRAVLYESAAGVKGNPYDILITIKSLK